MYKEAIKQKVRFKTSKGELSTEQMYDLSLEELDKVAISLEQDYENSRTKSFLGKKTEKDKSIKLKFDLVLDIIATKQAEEEVASKALDDKKHNERILDLIAKKQDGLLEEKSIPELKKMLR